MSSQEVDEQLQARIEAFEAKIEAAIKQGAKLRWLPQPGPQQLLLQCPCREVLIEGNRGSAKTDSLLMDYLQHVGQGFGPDWRGILFRLTYKELEHVIAKSKQWFNKLKNTPRYNESSHTWKWPTGEELLLRFMRVPNDYWDYHGHEYPWIGWEELTKWADDQCYNMMKSCNRSSNPDVPRKYRSNTNPFGVGHSWVKKLFIDPIPIPGRIINKGEAWDRTRIRATLAENKILTKADPEYVETLKAIPDPNLRKAWLEGSWDIVAGGAISDLWDDKIHFIPSFDIPAGWYRDRSFDWGSSKPFAVLWWAEADGHEVLLRDGTYRWFPKGTLFITAEYYGCKQGELNVGLKMTASEIARNIIETENNFMKVRPIGGSAAPPMIHPGPSDPSIWDASRGTSIAKQMENVGVRWEKGDNSPGSRIRGLETLRQYLFNSKQHPMEYPGLFVFDTNSNWRATVPSVPRDEKRMDDVDTNSEDHCYDATRYRVDIKRLETVVVSLGG